MRRHAIVFLVIISHLSFSCAVYAKSPILVLGTSLTTHPDLRGYVRAIPNTQTYAKFLIKTEPKQESIENLEQLFIGAQKAYFEESSEVAKQKFEKVLNLRLKSDWNEGQQKVFVFSALKIFELSEGKDRSRALQTAVVLDPQVELDQNVFSPRSRTAFTKKRSDIKFHSLPITGWIKSYEWLRWNGKTYDLSKTHKLKVPEGRFRFSFYSSRFQKISFVASADELISKELIPTPLVTANCDLKIPPKPNQKNTILDGDEICGHQQNKKLADANESISNSSIRTLSPNNSATKASVIEDSKAANDFNHSQKSAINFEQLNLAPRAVAQPTGSDPLPSQQNSLGSVQPKKWYENKWVWIGLSATAVAFFALDQSENARGSSTDANPTPVSYEK